MKNSLRYFSLLLAAVLAVSFFTQCAGPESRRTGEYLDDQSVNARVKASLVEDDDVSGLDVSTTTYDGVVQLSGFVDNEQERQRAEQVARRVDGVREVVNNITVNPRASEFGAPPEGEQPREAETGEAEPEPAPPQQ